MEGDNKPWEGMSWSEIVEQYDDIYARWDAGEEVQPPIDCPVDDLLPVMIRDLSPELQAVWDESNRLWDLEDEDGSFKLSDQVFKQTGFSRICRMREKMGATD